MKTREEQLAALYCRKVARLIPLGGAHKKNYLALLRPSVQEHIVRTGAENLGQLCEQFGTPDSHAEAFYTTMTAQDLSRNLLAARKVITVACITACLILAGTLGALFSMAKTSKDIQNGYYVIDIE